MLDGARPPGNSEAPLSSQPLRCIDFPPPFSTDFRNTPMAAPPSSGRVGVGFSFTSAPAQARAREAASDDALRILFVADFSGRGPRGIVEPFASRRPVRVDVDAADVVLAGFRAAIPHPCARPGADAPPLRFDTLDDFHPDALLRADPRLARVLDARCGLATENGEAAAARLREILPACGPGPHHASAQPPPIEPRAPNESDAATLARLLGNPPAQPTPPATPPHGIDVRNVVASIVGRASAAPAAPLGADGLAAAAEMDLSARLRTMLRDTGFRTIEAAWRSLDFLVRRNPGEERVVLAALDASLAEIDADPEGFRRLLAENPPRLLLVCSHFGATAADLASLERIARAASRTGAAVFAGAHPRLAGCADFSSTPDPDDWTTPLPDDVRDAWASFRALPEAAHVWLATPGFVLRQPYGHAGDPIEAFPFEEIAGTDTQDVFCLGNSAVLLALCTAEAFFDGQGDGTAAAAGQVGGLPVARYLAHAGTAAMPCAEAWLNDRAVARLHACGLSAVQSVRGGDRVHVLPASAAAR